MQIKSETFYDNSNKYPTETSNEQNMDQLRNISWSNNNEQIKHLE